MQIIKIALLLSTLLFTPAWLTASDQAEQQAEEVHVGTVIESQIGGKYLYLNVDSNGEKIWMATLPAFLGGKVSSGDKVQYSGGVEMTDFESKTLNRTFKNILFITKIKNLDAPALKDYEHVPADEYHAKIVKKDSEANLNSPARGEIKKAEQGKNIEEIFAEAEKLKDSEVTVKAKVMKVSSNILGKNWLTLQDGTGTPPDNKLTATTLETASTGDIVTVKGKLKTNVNLGAGYLYKVIIEEAEISK